MTFTLRQKRALLWTVTAGVLLAAMCYVAMGVLTPVRLDHHRSSKPGSSLPDAPTSDDRLESTAFAQIWTVDLQRPLFDAPKVEVKPSAPPPPPPLKLRLLGTIIEPGNSQAILQTSDNRIEFRRAGDTLDDATLLTIKENQVEVRYHDQTLTLASASAPASASGN